MGAQAQAAQTKVNIKKETVEDIVLRHSKRGMTILRKYMGDFYCKRAAEKILELPKGNIFLTTGFYVAGHAETDGLSRNDDTRKSTAGCRIPTDHRNR